MKSLLAIMFITLATALSAADYIPITIPTTADITKVFFADRFNGWVTTSAGELLSTFDSGKTWKLKQITNRAIADFAIRGKRGYLTGERGLLMKTTDGAASWQDISLNLKFSFSGVGIINDSTAIICGTDQNSMAKTIGETFATRDYGKTWEKQPRLGNGYFDIVAWPPKKVYLLAIKKTFHSISEGGNYWMGRYQGSGLGYAIDFQDDWGYLVGTKGLFNKTADHGRNWKEVPLQITKTLYAVGMFDHASGVAAGQGGVVVNFSEFGDEYTVENCGLNVDLTTISMTEDRVYFGGQKGTLLYRAR